MLRIFVFVTLFAWTSAADGGFAGFCAHEFNGTMADLPGGKKTCTATLDLEGVAQDSAEAICNHNGRFAVKEATAHKDSLTCTWETGGTCDEGHYIYRNCYKLSTGCSGDWKEVPLTDKQAFRWITHTFPGQKLLKFKLPSSAKKPTHIYYRNQLEPVTDISGKVMETAILLIRLPVFGGYPGDLVYIKNSTDEQIFNICRKLAFGESGTGPTGSEGVRGTSSKPQNYGSAASGNIALTGTATDIGPYTVWLTRNVYPIKLQNGQVDLYHFHSICERYCEACYAATPNLMDPVAAKFPKERFWMTGARGPIAAASDCNVKQQDSEMNAWKMLYHPIHKKSVILNGKYWQNTHPNRMCSDQGRYALAYEGGKVLSVPIFDRLPVACIQGRVPYLPADVSNCLKNSEDNGNGGCRCKAGFLDVNTPQLHAKQSPYIQNYIRSLNPNPGYVCVREDCRMNQRAEVPFDTILFVIDSSASLQGRDFAKMTEFLRDAVNWLPKQAAMWLCQYGTSHRYPSPPGCTYGGYDEYLASTGMLWTNEELLKQVNYVMNTQLTGASPTYEAIERVANWWIRDAQKIQHKALMIVITDGDDQQCDTGRIRQDQIRAKIRTNNIHLKYVKVGNNLHAGAYDDVLDVNKDILAIENYDNLKVQLKAHIISFMACDMITKYQIDEANQRGYE